jgi:hypothetical protein
MMELRVGEGRWRWMKGKAGEDHAPSLLYLEPRETPAVSVASVLASRITPFPAEVVDMLKNIIYGAGNVT